MKTGTCPKCNSNEIMSDVKVIGTSLNFPKLPPLYAFVEEPNRSLISDDASGQIQAYIYSKCGFTELYTDNLERLYEFYKKYKSK